MSSKVKAVKLRIGDRVFNSSYGSKNVAYIEATDKAWFVIKDHYALSDGSIVHAKFLYLLGKHGMCKRCHQRMLEVLDRQDD
jgi:hypothetical protein